MKIKKFLSILPLFLCLSSCNLNDFFKQNNDPIKDTLDEDEEEQKEEEIIEPIEEKEDEEQGEDPVMVYNESIFYDGIPVANDYTAYNNSTKQGNSWYNGAYEYGIVKSPYFTAKVYTDDESKNCNVYSANAVTGISSFIYIKKTTSSVKIDLTYINNIETVDLYNALNKVVPYTVSGKTITFTLSTLSSYTFIFNKDIDKAVTIFFERDIPLTRKEFNEKSYNPGAHDFEIVAEENERLIFKAGKHQVRNIVLKSNTELYFEDGAYIEAINPSSDNETPINPCDWAGMVRYKAFITSTNATNVRIYGRGIIDLAKLDFHARGGSKFEKVNSLIISDVMFNNSPEWTVTVACCKNVEITNAKIYGYRQNSDGFAIVDCNTVNVDNCFARSGDDLFEVKSMYGAETIEIKDIYFNNCVAWPEKARGYGIIAETKRDIKDVYYSNSIVIEYTPSWMDALGALIVYVENDGTISNINFNDMRIYNCGFYPINVTLGQDSKGKIQNINFTNISYYDDVKIRINNLSTSTIDNISFRNVKRNNSAIVQNEQYFNNSANLTNIKVY